MVPIMPRGLSEKADIGREKDGFSHLAKGGGGPLLVAADRCTGCGACANGCPKGAIHMTADDEGFLSPVVGEGCIQCGHCAHICPALKHREERSAPAVFAAWAEDDGLRRRSTNGGVFATLATQVLEDGGVVFGAAMDSHLTVRHVAVKNTADLPPLLGAKPVQSDVGDSFQQVRMYLDQGRRVLFAATGALLSPTSSQQGDSIPGICHALVIERRDG